jgi:hypothetical protein
VFPALLFFVLTFVMGRIVYQHRQRASGLQDRADRLERDQAARAARAVETERPGSPASCTTSSRTV